MSEFLKRYPEGLQGQFGMAESQEYILVRNVNSYLGAWKLQCPKKLHSGRHSNRCRAEVRVKKVHGVQELTGLRAREV